MMMHGRRQSENSVHESETAIDDDDESRSDSPHLSAPRMKKKMSHSSLFLRVTILKLRARVGTGMMKEQPSQIIGTATSRDQD